MNEVLQPEQTKTIRIRNVRRGAYTIYCHLHPTSVYHPGTLLVAPLRWPVPRRLRVTGSRGTGSCENRSHPTDAGQIFRSMIAETPTPTTRRRLFHGSRLSTGISALIWNTPW